MAMTRRFNGATTKESWKTWLLMRRADARGLAASMGPRRRSRGRRVTLVPSDDWPDRFNGATTKESWKTIADCR